MREIKFRVWDKINKKMRSFQTLRMENIFIDGEYGLARINQLGDNLSYKAPLDEFDLIQFTGLTDKNGKEIYEGDILLDRWTHFHVDDRKWIVEFGSHDTSSDYYASLAYGFYCKKPYATESLVSPAEWEVIGNIYENPELLNSAKEE